MKVPISEIYKAVQCEGRFNNPATFIRFWGCNLRCGFNKRADGKSQCDTPYAVFEGDKVIWDTMTIAKKITEYNISHVVFTGGEPLLYQKEILDVIAVLPATLLYEIETNGTIIPDPKLIRKTNVCFNVSVKLKSSNQWEGYDNKRINPEALKLFPVDRSIFKFVTSNFKDIEEIKKIIEHNTTLEVFLMPQGETREQILANLVTTLDLCMSHKYSFSNRDHILAKTKKEE